MIICVTRHQEELRLRQIQRGLEGSCEGNMPNRFFIVTRCLECLSSGVKRAGCADFVTLPSSVTFLSV